MGGQAAGKAGPPARAEHQASCGGPARLALSHRLRPAGPSLAEGGPRSFGTFQAQDKRKPEPRGCWKLTPQFVFIPQTAPLPPAQTARQRANRRPLIGRLRAGLGGPQGASGRVWGSLTGPLCDAVHRFSQARQSSHQVFRVEQALPCVSCTWVRRGQGRSCARERRRAPRGRAMDGAGSARMGLEANQGGPGPRGAGPGSWECVFPMLFPFLWIMGGVFKHERGLAGGRLYIGVAYTRPPGGAASPSGPSSKQELLGGSSCGGSHFKIRLAEGRGTFPCRSRGGAERSHHQGFGWSTHFNAGSKGK